MSVRPFFSTCVSWCSVAPIQALEWLCENADEITLEDFRLRVDDREFNLILSQLGYAEDPKNGLTIENDYHVRFHLERRTGIPFMVHSAIEYVFAESEDVDRVMEYISMVDDYEPR